MLWAGGGIDRERTTEGGQQGATAVVLPQGGWYAASPAEAVR